MIDSTSQLCFGGVSSRDICSVSLGGVALLCPDPQLYTEVTCKVLHQEWKASTATRWAKDFSLYQPAVPTTH